MSLITDKVFYNALRSNAELTATVGGRIYSTAIPVPDDDLANEPLPYLIISFDGLQNEGHTKDNSFEGDNDKVTISIEIAAESRDALGEITESVRQTIIEYFEDTDSHAWDDYQYVPDEYDFTASGIQYDPDKPCYWQVLQYVCDTNP